MIGMFDAVFARAQCDNFIFNPLSNPYVSEIWRHLISLSNRTMHIFIGGSFYLRPGEGAIWRMVAFIQLLYRYLFLWFWYAVRRQLDDPDIGMLFRVNRTMLAYDQIQ